MRYELSETRNDAWSAKTFCSKLFSRPTHVLRILCEYFTIIQEVSESLTPRYVVFAPESAELFSSSAIVLHFRLLDMAESEINKSLVPNDYIKMLERQAWEKVLAERAELHRFAISIGYVPPPEIFFKKIVTVRVCMVSGYDDDIPQPE